MEPTYVFNYLQMGYMEDIPGIRIRYSLKGHSNNSGMTLNHMQSFDHGTYGS